MKVIWKDAFFHPDAQERDGFLQRISSVAELFFCLKKKYMNLKKMIGNFKIQRRQQKNPFKYDQHCN